MTAPHSSAKISHVFDSVHNEGHDTLWEVEMTDKTYNLIPESIITKFCLITDKTTYTVEYVGCKCRYGNQSFRYVKWRGFNGHTRERVDIKLKEHDRAIDYGEFSDSG